MCFSALAAPNWPAKLNSLRIWDLNGPQLHYDNEARFALHHFAVAGKKIEKEIMLLHSFATEEICSASTC
jgi:hypothetical protein